MIQIIFSEYNTDSIFLCVQGIATPDSWQFMYKVRTESAVCTGLSEINSSKIATIYPNPVKEILNVNLANHFEHAEISVLSLDGKCLLEQTIKPGGSINIADLDAGVYVLNIQSGMEMQSIVFQKL